MVLLFHDIDEEIVMDSKKLFIIKNRLKKYNQSF